jgi:hypothetical protein
MDRSTCEHYIPFSLPCEYCDAEESKEKLKYQNAIHERFIYRAALEQLLQGINQNLGTHDHTDWELEAMVERAETMIAELNA